MAKSATLETVISQAHQLSPSDKLRLMAWLTQSLQAVVAQTSDEDWHQFIQRTYGSLADDPIQRWPEGDFEDRLSV